MFGCHVSNIQEARFILSGICLLFAFLYDVFIFQVRVLLAYLLACLAWCSSCRATIFAHVFLSSRYPGVPRDHVTVSSKIRRVLLSISRVVWHVNFHAEELPLEVALGFFENGSCFRRPGSWRDPEHCRLDENAASRVSEAAPRSTVGLRGARRSFSFDRSPEAAIPRSGQLFQLDAGEVIMRDRMVDRRSTKPYPSRELHSRTILHRHTPPPAQPPRNGEPSVLFSAKSGRALFDIVPWPTSPCFPRVRALAVIRLEGHGPQEVALIRLLKLTGGGNERRPRPPGLRFS